MYTFYFKQWTLHFPFLLSIFPEVGGNNHINGDVAIGRHIIVAMHMYTFTPLTLISIKVISTCEAASMDMQHVDSQMLLEISLLDLQYIISTMVFKIFYKESN